MAKISVEKITKDVEVVVKEKKVVNANVTLTLTLEEALSLLFVLSNVGGSPDDTCRKYTNSVFDKLNIVNSLNKYPMHITESVGGSLYWNIHSLVELKKYIEHYLNE